MIEENQLISHLYQNRDNGQWMIQTNDEHQKGVADMAASFAGQFGLPSWGRALGLLHDKGKERAAFQQYIRKMNGLPTSDKKRYDDHTHAFVGGILAKELMGKDVSHLLVNQIISHHTGLHDFGDVGNILKERLLSKEINEGDISINKPLLFQEFIDSPFSKSKVEWKHFHHLSRMLFSCLVVKEQCSRTSSSEKGFYSLTVPTGGGKTLSSLLWAMKHAVSHSMNRIIIAIPYTSIIVQTAGLLKEIFGEENVLEHHSNFDPDDIKDEENREKAKLATENWDYPIIVTTNVQLFESMFSNKTSDCRKLHNMANSILVLDEVQMLPTGFLRPIVDALEAYQEMFGVSVLFTTASQPVLSGLIEGTNPKADFKGIEHIKEIIPEEFALHDQLRRVKLSIDDTGKTYDEIAAKVSEYNKVLCIVNTRKDAKELYDRLPNDGVKLHLSRMMCPAHLHETIGKIKTLLKDESQPIVRVIATQLVEAGVDIDFPVVFRQEAGLDSVLQAAGRCNREGRSAMGHTFVFSLAAEKRKLFGSMADSNNARLNLPEDSDWFAPSTMKAYFCQLYSRKQTFDEKDIKHWLYKPTELCFETASKEFRLIDDTSINVIVNWENSMELIEQLKESGCTYSLVKQLAKFTVGIRSYDFKQLKGYGLVEEILEGIYVLADRSQYNKTTGLSLDNHWLEEVLMI